MIGRLYYYFVASLPTIYWGGKCLMSVEDFCSMARRLLSAEDSALVEQLVTGDPDDIQTENTMARSWIRFYRNLRNEIALFRAQRAHQDPHKAVRGTKESDPRLKNIVQEASKMPDLLEAEKLIDQTCWQFLDEASTGHHFDLEFLICYGLKLKILKRHQEYHSSKGKNLFDGIQAMKLPIDWAVSGI